jgi:ADP-heptose:LPS heptosyltransferase
VKLLKELRKENYELVVDFQGLFRSGILAWCARSCITAGFARPREKSAAFFYNRKFDVVMEQHAVSRYVELANRICGTDYAVPECPVNVAKPPFPEVTSPYVVLVPGARWESKVFPAELFGKIILEARKTFPGCGAVIVGGPGEKAAAETIRQMLPDAVDLTGRTSLVQLVSVMALARAALTNDSGPMHIAALTRTCVFSLFGPTLPQLTGPYGAEHRVFAREDLNCCGCMKRCCPLTPGCLCHNIDPVRVGTELGKFLNEKNN